MCTQAHTWTHARRSLPKLKNFLIKKSFWEFHTLFTTFPPILLPAPTPSMLTSPLITDLLLSIVICVHACVRAGMCSSFNVVHGREAVHLGWIACQGACPQGSQSPLFQQPLIAYDSYKDEVYQIFIIFILLFNVCVCTHACLHAHHGTHTEVRRQFLGLFPSFYHVDPEDWTQVVGLSGKHFYLLNHLASSKGRFL